MGAEEYALGLPRGLSKAEQVTLAQDLRHPVLEPNTELDPDLLAALEFELHT